MTVRIAINGLGRIGRCIVRAAHELKKNNIEIVAVNGPADINGHVHLLKYDSVHGVFPYVEKINDQTIKVGNQEIAVSCEYDPEKLPWKKLGVDIVMECTGKFKSKEDGLKHIKAGAKKVIISAPGEHVDATVVFGVNNEVLKKDQRVISIGSCTTNCLAPVAKVLQDGVGIERGFMTTVHAYTNDQNLMDNRHKDLQRARAAALSMIPSSTGAAKAIGVVLPDLAGKLDGTAIRVPTPNVSFVDLTFTASKPTSVSEINTLMEKAAKGKMKGVLDVVKEPLVSTDFNHNPHSSNFDTLGTKVVDGTFCRVASWYDNEWGFSVRMLDVAEYWSNL